MLSPSAQPDRGSSLARLNFSGSFLNVAPATCWGSAGVIQCRAYLVGGPPREETRVNLAQLYAFCSVEFRFYAARKTELRTIIIML
jgi:hypothetical protein